MGVTTAIRIPHQSPTNIDNGQRGGLQPCENREVPTPKSPHRAQIPLPEESRTEWINRDNYDPRQRQPSGPPNEALAYELDQSMEGAMDGIDWDWLDTYLRELE